MKFCQSCTAPLTTQEYQAGSSPYCRHCEVEDGILKPYTVVRQGIAAWFKGWQPNITPETADERAGHFMKAMPAWAHR